VSLTEPQLDALRELANIGSGTASTSLAAMVGRPIDVSVPRALALPLRDAVEAVGDAEDTVTGVVLGLLGDPDGLALLLFSPADEAAICTLLGVEAGTEIGRSALAEIGNVLVASYVGALGAMTGTQLEPDAPQVLEDMQGAIVASALLPAAEESDSALLLDSDLRIEGESCSFRFLLLPAAGGVEALLTRLGVFG
jgi:chemotaxis protein CheC